MTKLWIISAATFIAVCAIAIAGCKSRTTPSVAGIGGQRYGKTTASWVLWGKKTAIIVWSDTEFYSGGGISDNGELLSVRKRTYNFPGGPELEWECETKDGRSGPVIINGVTYELADGSLFLVSTKEGVIRVLQLEREWIWESPPRDAAKTLAQNDPEVCRFIAAADRLE